MTVRLADREIDDLVEERYWPLPRRATIRNRGSAQE